MSFAGAGPQKSDLIPNGVIALLSMKIDPGGTGEGGWWTVTDAKTGYYLKTELTVVEGPYAKRKVFAMFPVYATDDAPDGVRGWVQGGHATLRAILESARGIDPRDPSPAADAKRVVNDWAELQGLQFLAKIGIEKGKDGYDDKNKIKTVITLDMKEFAIYKATGPVAAGSTAPTNTPAATATPTWAPPAGSVPNSAAPAIAAPVTPAVVPPTTPSWTPPPVAPVGGPEPVPTWTQPENLPF
jgi:hypothetical protein